MTFHALIDHIPAGFEIDLDGLRASIAIPLSRSEDGTTVFAEVRLWGGHWRGVAMHRFKYAIVVLDGRSARLVEIFDRYEAAPFLEPVRSLVLPTICAAAEALIRAVLPDVIYRATFLTSPPPNSLRKHHMVTELILRLGYEVAQEGADPNGRWYWLMIRSGDE